MDIEKIKTFIGGAAAGAVVLLIVLFTTDWMVSANAAETAAAEAANQSMVESLAPICVTQFNADANREALIKELKNTSSWEQPNYIQKHGWSTMPGAEKAADRDVAKECARLLTVE